MTVPNLTYGNTPHLLGPSMWELPSDSSFFIIFFILNTKHATLTYFSVLYFHFVSYFLCSYGRYRHFSTDFLSGQGGFCWDCWRCVGIWMYANYECFASICIDLHKWELGAYDFRLRSNDVLFRVKCLKPQCTMCFILSYRQMRTVFLSYINKDALCFCFGIKQQVIL